MSILSSTRTAAERAVVLQLQMPDHAMLNYRSLQACRGARAIPAQSHSRFRLLLAKNCCQGRHGISLIVRNENPKRVTLGITIA